MDLQTNSDASKVDLNDLLEVIVSDDNMTGYILLKKRKREEGADGEQPPAPVIVTAEQMLQALQKEGIVYGIKEDTIRKLAMRPVYGIKIEVAKGTEPVDGEDGYVNFFVKRDSEYKPEISEEGVIDYKNLDYFQQVTEGEVLCEIIKETDGTD
ncbi:MAG TPA: FapA family protein, partial [Bacillota bacterium]|nr:FapA family protein [Bacillota bacterium]